MRFFPDGEPLLREPPGVDERIEGEEERVLY